MPTLTIDTVRAIADSAIIYQRGEVEKVGTNHGFQKQDITTENTEEKNIFISLCSLCALWSKSSKKEETDYGLS